MILNSAIAQGWDFGTWQLATLVRNSKSKLYPVVCFIQNPWLISIPLIDRKKYIIYKTICFGFLGFFDITKMTHQPSSLSNSIKRRIAMFTLIVITVHGLQYFHMVTNILVISQVKVLLANAAKACNNKH